MPRSEFDLLVSYTPLACAPAIYFLQALLPLLDLSLKFCSCCLSVEVLLTCRSARVEGRSRGSPWEAAGAQTSVALPNTGYNELR